MVFTFEHVDLDEQPGGPKWDLAARCRCRCSRRNLATWQDGLADVGWNSLYWNNHDQPRAVSRFGDDCPEHRVASAKTLGTVLHLHRGTPYVYQGEELGMTNAPLHRRSTSTATSSRSTTTREAARGRGAGRDGAGRRSPLKGRDNARTPMQWDAGPHAGFTTGDAVAPGQPEPRPRSTPLRHRPTRTRCSTTTGALIALRHDDARRRRRPVRAAAARPPAALGHRARRRGPTGSSCVANCSSEPATADAADLPDLAGATVLLATHPGHEGLDLLPWESRVYEVRS